MELFPYSGETMGSRWWHIRELRGAVLPTGLAPLERSLLIHHIISALLTGLSMGTLTLADTILAKTLNASPFAITAISVIMGGGFLAALFWGGAMRHRRKAPFIFGAALIGRLALGLTGLWRNPAWFVALVGLAWVAQAVITTAQVSIIRSAYDAKHRDQLFGLTVSAATLTRLLSTVVAGHLLDWNEYAYGWIFAVAALGGFIGAYFLVRMERILDQSEAAQRQTADRAPSHPIAQEGSFRPLEEPGRPTGLRSMRDSVQLVLRILKEDHAYRKFELNFFVYGVAFMALLPMVPLFLVRDLGLDYTTIGLARGLMGQAGLILLTPLLGRLLRRLKPVRFSAWIFGFLALYPGLLLAASLFPTALRIPLVYTAFTCFGIAMAGVSLSWNLSSIHFAGEEDPSAYQAVHSALVGVRGVFAPVLGYLVITHSSNKHGFLLCTALFIVAALLMVRLASQEEATRTAQEP